MVENSSGNKETVTQKPSDHVILPVEGASQIVICPYLALFDDPDTKLMFPSPAGYCHHVTPEQAIDLGHQQSFCLNVQHMICAAFVTEDLQVLPAGIERPFVRDNGRFVKIGIILVGLIAAIFFGMMFFDGNNEPPSSVDSAEGNSNGSSIAALMLTTTIPAETSTVTPTLVAIPPSSTPSPSPTLMPTASATPPPSPSPSPTVESTDLPTLTPSPTPKPLPIAEVIPARLNIRGGPSTNYPVLVVVESGTLFDIIGQLSDGSWYQLCCVGDGDTDGWVLAESVNATGLVDEIPFSTNIPPLPVD